MKFNFFYKGKKREIDVRVCKSVLEQTHGLMFKRKSKALLFVFNKPVMISIHSFFCRPFIIVWFNGKRIVDIKKVSPFRLSVKPNKKFDKFLEIPTDNLEYSWFSSEKRRKV